MARSISFRLTLALVALGSIAVARPAAAGPSTPMRSYSPAADAVFKSSAVCHDVTRDVYVVAAVFRRTTMYPVPHDYDALYRIRVQGSSAATNYGEMLEAPALLTTAARIDNVDCASDDASAVFVAFDRAYANAAFLKLDGTTSTGPIEIPTNYCGPNTHRPRLSVGNGRVEIVFDGVHWEDGGTSCEACARQFYASSGSPVSGSDNIVWNDNMTHSDYDVEWNGSDRFVFALPFSVDAGTKWLATYQFSGSTGAQIGANTIQSYGTGTPAYAQKTRLVFGKNTRNPSAMVLQTDTAAYWLNTSGALVGAAQNVAIGTGFAMCEYWGADTAAATLFVPNVSMRYVGTYPNGSFVFDNVTTRRHYGVASAAPYESFNLDTGYNPVACDGGNTYADPELLLVSKPASSSPNPSVWWHVVASD